jgi:hypothetical protein
MKVEVGEDKYQKAAKEQPLSGRRKRLARRHHLRPVYFFFAHLTREEVVVEFLVVGVSCLLPLVVYDLQSSVLDQKCTALLAGPHLTAI